MKEQLKSICLSLGADAVGVSGVQPIHADRIYREPLSFEEKNKSLRLHPKAHFPEAKSALVVLLRHQLYQNELKAHQVKQASSSVRDYHLEMRELLGRIAVELSTRGIRSKAICDTEGLLDKEMAVSAGLGYFARNTLVMHPEFGTSFHIGYLLIDHELAPDEPLVGDCGHCTRCRDHCPYGAIGNYRLEPKRCISYMTQAKDALSCDLHGFFYGCDICQRVCPQNRVEAYEEALIYSVDYFNDLSHREFNKKCRDKEFAWIGKNKVIRNCSMKRRHS